MIDVKHTHSLTFFVHAHNTAIHVLDYTAAMNEDFTKYKIFSDCWK